LTPGGEDTAQRVTIPAVPPHTTPVPVSIPLPPPPADSPRKEPAKLVIGQTALTYIHKEIFVQKKICVKGLIMMMYH
jgi:hypothetical protein